MFRHIIGNRGISREGTAPDMEQYLSEWVMIQDVLIVTSGGVTNGNHVQLNGAQTSYTFTGLNGNADLRYKMYFFFNLAGSGTVTSAITCNTDTNTNNYPYQSLIAATTTVSATNNHDNNGWFVGYITTTQYNNADLEIWAKSGTPRFAKQSMDLYTASAMTAVRRSDGIWTNTADNITQLVLTASAAGGLTVGSYFALYKANLNTN
jgi:hypothetical protein